MKALSLRPKPLDAEFPPPRSPSKIPMPVTPCPSAPQSPVKQAKSRQKPTPKVKKFLTKDSNLEAWDHEEQYNNMERMYQDMCSKFNMAVEDHSTIKDSLAMYKSAVIEQEKKTSGLIEANAALRTELETAKYCLLAAERAKEELKQDCDAELASLKRHHRTDLENLRREQQDEIDRLQHTHREEMRRLRKELEDEIENEKIQRIQALQQASTQGALDEQRRKLDVESKEHEIKMAKAESDLVKSDLEREKTLNADLQNSLLAAAASAATMESARQALQAKIEYLESDSKTQSEAYAEMERRMREAIDEAADAMHKLRKEETLRRKLHNQVQELKGNIRVFCRVRPMLNADGQTEQAKITIPEDDECKDIEVKGIEEKSSLGTDVTKTYPFSFDRVFDSTSSNSQIFEEISQLIQSALDGYNVCIFAYGQTGSGKTYTMSAEDGMIPQALRQIYSTSKSLEERGWRYTMEGSFIEVYNENIHDLLGPAEDVDKKKHEIRHDMQKCETTITDVTTVNLDSQDQVESILAQAVSKRSVAATRANERSSRSHSVFILKLAGHNGITGEQSKGTLNLVDLAGSERLSQSKVEGARLKETQNINKSLSCLGDVIGALGQGKDGGHIPYRNSKLTHLLQFSLGGNSKTLMFVMVSPLKEHLGETITSLKFATKVGSTHVGPARKVNKI